MKLYSKLHLTFISQFYSIACLSKLCIIITSLVKPVLHEWDNNIKLGADHIQLHTQARKKKVEDCSLLKPKKSS